MLQLVGFIATLMLFVKGLELQATGRTKEAAHRANFYVAAAIAILGAVLFSYALVVAGNEATANMERIQSSFAPPTRPW